MAECRSRAAAAHEPVQPSSVKGSSSGNELTTMSCARVGEGAGRVEGRGAPQRADGQAMGSARSGTRAVVRGTMRCTTPGSEVERQTPKTYGVTARRRGCRRRWKRRL